MVEKITDAQDAIASNVQSIDASAIAQQEQMKQMQDKLDAQSLVDQANQKMAEMLYSIEDGIIDIRKKLDALLGKNIDPRLDPDVKDFNLDFSMADIDKLLKPLMSVTSPLVSVFGAIPIVGQLPKIMADMKFSFSSLDGMDLPNIEDMLPSLPELSPTMKSEIEKIQNNISALCIKLPMMLINLIFKMINVIYSKLKIITSIIPLGSFFPLNLIGSAITAEPTIENFVTTMPSQIKDMVTGMMKKVQAAQAVLAVPQPPAGIPDPTNAQTQNDASQSPSDSQIAEARTNEPTTSKIASPVKSNIPVIQPTPPIQVPSKTLDEIESYWEGEFKKMKLCVFAELPSYNVDSYDNVDFHRFVKRFRLNDEWMHLKNAVEFWSVEEFQTKNTFQIDKRFKSIFNNIANKTGCGFMLEKMYDYRGWDTKHAGELDSRLSRENMWLNVMKPDMKQRFMCSRMFFCEYGYISEHRLTNGSEELESHIERLRNDARYRKTQKTMQDVDCGIAKYGNILSKYYYFKEDSFLNFNDTAFIGRNKMKNLDD